MDPVVIGWTAAAFTVLSAIPYIRGVWRKEIAPNQVSWGIWSLVGLALFLTYKGSGAVHTSIMYFFGFLNPTAVFVLSFFRKTEREPLTWFDKGSFIGGVTALAGWLFFQANPSLIVLVLCLAILADACAAIPTFWGLWKKPLSDRPLAWALFSVANAINLFAVTEQNFASYVLPVYMLFGSLFIQIPMVLYRVQHRTPLRLWY